METLGGLMLAASLLSACGGTGGTATTGKDAQALFLGTRAGASEAANGLAFATPGATLTDALGQTIEVKAIGFDYDYEAGGGVIRFLTANLVGAGGGRFSLEEATFTFEGQTYTLSDSQWVGEGTDRLSIGGWDKNFVGLFNLFGSLDERYVDVSGVWGLQSDPAAIAARGHASVAYAGFFEGYVVANRADGSLDEDGRAIGGAVALDVDFDSGTVGGSLTSGDFYHYDAGGDAVAVETTMTFAGASIDGNGFATGTTVTCSTGTCSGDALLAGSFYGPVGQEVAGILEIDLVHADPSAPDGAVSTFGGAYFYGEEQP